MTPRRILQLKISIEIYKSMKIKLALTFNGDDGNDDLGKIEKRRMRRTAGILGRRSAEMRPDDLGFLAEKRREDCELQMKNDKL